MKDSEDDEGIFLKAMIFEKKISLAIDSRLLFFSDVIYHFSRRVTNEREKFFFAIKISDEVF